MIRVKWTDAQNEYLEKHYNTKPMHVLKKILKHSETAIKKQASRLGYTNRKTSTSGNNKLKNIAVEQMKPMVITNGKLLQQRTIVKKPYCADPTDNKMAIKIDPKTTVYVPKNYTDKQVEELINHFRKK